MTKPDSQRIQTDSYRNQKEKNYVIWNKQNYTCRKIISWKAMWGRKDKLERKKKEFEIHEIQTKNILMFVCLFLTPGSSLRASATDSCLGYFSRSTEKATEKRVEGLLSDVENLRQYIITPPVTLKAAQRSVHGWLSSAARPQVNTSRTASHCSAWPLWSYVALCASVSSLEKQR